MGRVFRIWRGDWKKNAEEQWNFLPNHEDYGFTMWMDSPETFEVIDETVRENYMLGSATPVLVTYGMPDWMMFPSGPSPPITVATTADLVALLSQRPHPAEITLLVTFGAKKVAEFNFLSRSDFTIGSSTYVVGSAQDEIARARYECKCCILLFDANTRWSVDCYLISLFFLQRWFWVKGFSSARE